jgi:hypothetical protein
MEALLAQRSYLENQKTELYNKLAEMLEEKNDLLKHRELLIDHLCEQRILIYNTRIAFCLQRLDVNNIMIKKLIYFDLKTKENGSNE